MTARADVDLRPRRPLWRSPALLGLAAAVVAWLAAWLAGSWIAARQLRHEVESRFAGTVTIGSLHYLPPYWLVVHDLALTSLLDGEPVAWLRVGSVHGSLAWLPFAGGSVQLAELSVAQAAATVVRDADGVHQPLDLWRADAEPPPRTLPVRRVTVDGARLVVRDRTVPASPALEIGPFALSLDARDPAGQSFACTLAGGDALLTVAGSGMLDLAQGTLAVARLDGSVHPGGAGAGAVSEIALRDAGGTVDLGARTGRVVGGSLVIGGEPPVALDDVHASLALGAGRLDVTGAGARVADGAIDGSVSLLWDGAPRWQASGKASDLTLARLAPRFPALGGRTVQGRVSGRGSFSGILTADVASWLDALRGEGSGRARDGRFYQVPLVAKLLEQSNFASQETTLSEAAASFRIAAPRTIHLDNAALGSPTIGVQGQGDIGFDGRISLEMFVVPLGSWKAAVARSNVPLVGGALASLAGSVQSLFGKASALAYQFRISGTIEDPQLAPVPVPALTKTAADVIGRMATVGWAGDVLGD